MKVLSGRTILVVDDEAGLREILEEEFTYHGAIVTAVDSGNAAYALLLARPFDAVVTDVLMTDGDGPSLIKRINDVLDPRPKNFLCTGYSDLTREQMAHLGINAVFEKPFERDHLIAVIARELDAEGRVS